jgi:hypothetical protein
MYHAVGIYTPGNMQEYHVDVQQWKNITGEQSGDPQSTQEKYSNSDNAMTEFITGTVYLKGVIDGWFQGNWIVAILTTGMQAGVYFLAVIGSLAWVLNRVGA